MLDLAINHEEELQARYRETLFSDKHRYYHRFSTVGYFLELSLASDVIQMVSLDDGKVGGFFSANINRETDTAYNLNIINFNDRNPVFTADLFDFFILLFTQFGIERIVWDVIVGNPAESFYDRIAENYGGRVVGFFRNEARLYDGRLYDVKYYEMYRDQALQAVRDKGVDGSSYR